MAVLDELLVRLGVDMSEAEGEVDQGAQGIENRLNGLSVAGGVAAAGLGAAFVAGLGAAMDISSVTTQLQNQLSLTDEEAARAGDIAGDVFSAGFGESIGEVGEALGAVSSSMEEFGSISDKEMAQLTKDALALAKTFQFDVGEATAAAGNLIKSGLAKDGTQAMDLLAKTAQQVPKAMAEELPAVSKEYSEFFSQLGFTGPEMFGLLAKAAKDPTFELDKLGDAVKEFSLRLAETDQVKEPLKELGLDVADIQKLVNTGKGTQAFDQVTKALKGVEDQTTRTRLQAALFGGPGEDMGNSLLNLSATGAAAATGMDDAAGAAKSVTDGMEASPAQQWDSVMRTLTTTLGETMLPILQAVSGLFAKYPGLVQVLVPLVLGLAAALAIAAAAQWVMNAALLANPVTWIIIAVIALVAAIVMLWKNWDTVTKAMGDAWDWLTSGLSDGWNWLVRTVFGPIGRFFTSTIPGWVDTGVGWIKDRWNDLIGFFAGIPGRLAAGARGMWDFIKEGLKGALNGAISLINDGIWFINSSLIGNANRIPGVDIPYIPYVPYLAKGGIATGPTMAMVGEGRESEAILPLSRLEGMLNTVRSPAAASVAPAETRVVWEWRGGPSSFRDWVQEQVRITAGGSIVKYAEE